MDDTYTAFAGDHRLATGSLTDVAAAVRAAMDSGAGGLVIFADQSGRTVDIDTRPGSAESPAASPVTVPAGKPARGRPKLGVTAREVTLLPRHWEWLSKQSGGASAALRRLVDQARRESAGEDQLRERREAVHRVLTTLAGNLPAYEEALRSLYSGDEDGFAETLRTWPDDIRLYVQEMMARG